MTIEAGQQLLHYRLIEKIGEGGMGVVWKAEDTRLHRQVALKLVSEESAADTRSVERHLREARAASALNHPNICSIHDIGEWDERRFIVMELLEGRSLQQQIGTGPLSIDAALELAIQIADALDAAHAKGIVHRDIKPANIFLVGDGSTPARAKMLDFGLAKLSAVPAGGDEETRTALGATKPGTVMGTVPYMSPEQALGKPLDTRTDVFSLGVVLYEMVTARRAFEGDTSAGVFDAILNHAPTAPVEINADVPAEFERIINKALEKDPGLRYQSAAELRSDLKRLRRDSDAGTAAPVGRSRNWWLVLAAVAIVAILVWQLPSLLRRGDVGPTGDRRTLVVLPFANIGGDPEQEFFSDGMTEEVRGVLGAANPDRLRVIARTSSMQFQEGAVSIRAIRDALGVTHVVEGSVRRQGSVVRISAKLIDASDETQIWTNSFDGTLDDIFALQSRVANQIAEALAVNLLPGAVAVGRDYAPDPRAYEEYLSGRFWDYKGTQEGYQKAIAHYEQAVAIDPGFALVWASLSQTSSTLASWTTLSPIELLVRAEEAMNKAFELDPDLPDAHVARAYYQLLGQWEWQDADATFERALTMNPSNPGMAHHWHGHYLSFAGRNQDALDAFAAALRIDPLSALHRSCLGLTQIAAGDLDLAERSLEQALERAPQLPIAHSWLGLLRERQGKLEEAVAAWQEASEFGGGVGLFTGPLGYGYGRLGRVEEARDLLGGLLATEDGEYVAALNIARVYAGIGEIDRAFEQLEIAVEKREPWILGLRIGPGFDTLHDDPRYVDLLRRIGVDP